MATDLDLQKVDLVVNSSSNTLRIDDHFEGFIGAAYDDIRSFGLLDATGNIDGGGVAARSMRYGHPHARAREYLVWMALNQNHEAA